MTSSFPSGWTVASIGEIADLNPRHSRDLDEHLPISFVPMAGVDEDQPKFKFTEERLLGEVRQGFTHFAEGDVLFAKITPCMENGKAAVAAGLKNGLGCGSTEFHVMRPHHGIDPKYLYRFIHQESFRRMAKQNFTGTAGQARVPISFVREAAILLAPANEQKRIVEKLEPLLCKVSGCNSRLERIPTILKRFRQSVLAAACSGRLTTDWREQHRGDENASDLLDLVRSRRQQQWITHRLSKNLSCDAKHYASPCEPSGEFEFDAPTSWARCSMDELTTVITSGSRDWKKYYADSGSGTFVMAQNVRPMHFDQGFRLIVDPPVGDRDRIRSEVKKDDLLVTIVGANTGNLCRVPSEVSEHYVCQSVALMRPVEAASSRFLELYLNSAFHGLAQYRKWIYGEGRPHLSFDNLKETVIYLPPLVEQQEIVRRVESLFTLADQLEARYKKGKAYVDKLTQSILAKAFRGELVPQDPADEPAEKLLERIREGGKTNKRTTDDQQSLAFN